MDVFVVSMYLALVFHSDAAQVNTIKVGPAYFAETAYINNEQVPYRNGSVFRYFGFSVYSAALYLPEDAPDGSGVLGRYPKRLSIHYLRDIPKSAFVESANAIIQKNPNVDFELNYPKLETMYNAFQDVKAGDRYELSYAPGRATVLSLNGKEVCSVAGDDFAEAFFGIWLSETPISKSLRDRLLTRKKR